MAKRKLHLHMIRFCGTLFKKNGEEYAMYVAGPLSILAPGSRRPRAFVEGFLETKHIHVLDGVGSGLNSTFGGEGCFNMTEEQKKAIKKGTEKYFDSRLDNGYEVRTILEVVHMYICLPDDVAPFSSAFIAGALGITIKSAKTILGSINNSCRSFIPFEYLTQTVKQKLRDLKSTFSTGQSKIFSQCANNLYTHRKRTAKFKEELEIWRKKPYQEQAQELFTDADQLQLAKSALRFSTRNEEQKKSAVQKKEKSPHRMEGKDGDSTETR